MLARTPVAERRRLYEKALQLAQEMPKDHAEAVMVLEILCEAYGLFLGQCGPI